MSRVFEGMRARAAGLATGAGAFFFSAGAFAEELMGQPTPGGIGLQPAASPLKHHAHFFHDVVLMPIITVITLFVLALILWVVVRYNKRANPVPARWSHNTLVEVVWTVVPVLILMFIAIFSFRLLFEYHDTPKVDLTAWPLPNRWSCR
jgi:cytochrome c oxidase subunit 2